jgi:hypothetical protein
VIFVTLLTPDSGETEDGLASPFFVCGTDLTDTNEGIFPSCSPASGAVSIIDTAFI